MLITGSEVESSETAPKQYIYRPSNQNELIFVDLYLEARIFWLASTNSEEAKLATQ